MGQRPRIAPLLSLPVNEFDRQPPHEEVVGFGASECLSHLFEVPGPVVHTIGVFSFAGCD
jgi:hypothetical protein